MGIRILSALALSVLALSGQQPTGAAVDPPWTPAQVLHATDLSKTLAAKSAPQPKVFQVGFEVLYRSKHIPGSIYAGPGSKDAGLDELKKAVANVSKDTPIVLYCGCCPWDHCPNMKAPFKLLQSLGFKQVKVMELPNNFDQDWIEKGFPVEGATAGLKR